MSAGCTAAKAKELLEKQTSGNPLEKKLRSLPTPARSSMEAADSELMLKMLKKILLDSSELSSIAGAKTLVIILKTSDLQEKMKQYVTLWHDIKPEVTLEMKEKRQWPEHPLGFVHGYLHSMLIDVMKEAMASDVPTTQTLQVLESINVVDVEKIVSSVKPKHARPRDGRPWIWFLMMTDLATEEYKNCWRQLVGKSNKSITIDVKKGGQQDTLTQELWTEFKRRAPIKHDL